jgi:hypothetical protein
VATPVAAVTAAASGTAAERAVETSRALWGSSPVVVLAGADVVHAATVSRAPTARAAAGRRRRREVTEPR